MIKFNLSFALLLAVVTQPAFGRHGDAGTKDPKRHVVEQTGCDRFVEWYGPQLSGCQTGLRKCDKDFPATTWEGVLKHCLKIYCGEMEKRNESFKCNGKVLASRSNLKAQGFEDVNFIDLFEFRGSQPKSAVTIFDNGKCVSD